MNSETKDLIARLYNMANRTSNGVDEQTLLETVGTIYDLQEMINKLELEGIAVELERKTIITKKKKRKRK